MITTQPSQLVIMAWLSLAVSLALGLMPFLTPHTPVGFILAVNWVLFMTVGYMACPKPFRMGPPFRKMESSNFAVFRTVFLAFTAAGWIVIMMGQPLI